MIARALILSASLLARASFVYAQEDHSHAQADPHSRLGNVVFANSGASGAQVDFLREIGRAHV